MGKHTLLAFDFGTKRIGVAVGQTITHSAQPLTVIHTHAGTTDWDEISTLINRWTPEALIVGRPVNLDGSPQPITALAEDFANTLQTRYQLPVHKVDERLSTVEARAMVFASGGYRALEKKAVDSVAAQIILQDWLNQLSSASQAR